MRYLEIRNNGLIEVEALSLIGASTKVGDESKIGQFGSGNKYSLAYLLRNNYKVLIFSGLEQIKITTKPVTFRNEEFRVIEINGESTGITDSMGKNWKAWQVIREIYSNSMDEGGSSIKVVDDVLPKENETVFYIEMKEEMINFMENFDNYFSTNKTVLFECELGQIVEKTGESINIYRKGIKCVNYTKKSIYDYNLFNVDIDENRLIKYNWEAEEAIWDMIFRCTNKDVLTKLFHNVSGGNFESDISSVATLNSSKMSNECIEVLESMKIAPDTMTGLLKPEERQAHIIFPAPAFEAIRHVLKNKNVGDKFKVYHDGIYREIEPDKMQDGVIKNALAFLNDCGFHIPFIIKVGIFADKDIQGCADNDVIILSEVNLECGVTEVINTIIEEYIHIKYSVKDETRGFQTAIITEFITYMKNHNK